MHAYLIDVVGTCNLRCPSCPVGNMKAGDFVDRPRAKGFMQLDLFTSIVDKIVADQAGKPFQVHLYNWGEPMLHPEFDEICKILAKRQVWFHVSSNMNHEASFTQLVRTAAGIRASTSGFSNDTYQKSHVGGDINLFISNLYRLRYAIDKTKSGAIVQVYYHIYKDNCDDNMIKLSKLCNDLGFVFSPTFAYFMGLEKYIYHIEGSEHFSEKDREIESRMLFSIDDALAVAKYGRQHDCELRQTQTVINFDGSVATCCTVFDPKHNIATDFLATNPTDLHAGKMASAICETCMNNNLHHVVTWNPADLFEEMAVMKQLENGQKYIARASMTPSIREVKYTEDGPVFL